MAVFEYTGLVGASGKQVKGVRDADNAKVLRATLKREGVLLTSAHEATGAQTGQKRNIDIGAFFRRVSEQSLKTLLRG